MNSHRQVTGSVCSYLYTFHDWQTLRSLVSFLSCMLLFTPRMHIAICLNCQQHLYQCTTVLSMHVAMHRLISCHFISCMHAGITKVHGNSIHDLQWNMHTGAPNTLDIYVCSTMGYTCMHQLVYLVIWPSNFVGRFLMYIIYS